jgi:hypothetical protein
VGGIGRGSLLIMESQSLLLKTKFSLKLVFSKLNVEHLKDVYNLVNISFAPYKLPSEQLISNGYIELFLNKGGARRGEGGYVGGWVGRGGEIRGKEII